MIVKKKNIGVLLILVAAAAILLAPNNFLSKDFDSAQALGNLVGLLLLCYFVARFFTRNKSEEVRENLILVFGLIAIIWSISVIYLEHSSTKQINALVDAVATKNIDSINDSPLQAQINIPGYSASSKNQTQILLQAALLSSKSYLKEMDAYNEDLSKLPLEEALNPKIFNSRESIENGRNLINKAEFYQTQISKLDEKIYDAQVKAVEASSVDLNSKESFMKGLTESHKQGGDLRRIQLLESKKILDAARTILNLAEKNLGKVVINNQSIGFPTQRDNDLYNQSIMAMTKAAQEEANARNNYLKFQESKINALKSLTQ